MKECPKSDACLAIDHEAVTRFYYGRTASLKPSSTLVGLPCESFDQKHCFGPGHCKGTTGVSVYSTDESEQAACCEGFTMGGEDSDDETSSDQEDKGDEEEDDGEYKRYPCGWCLRHPMSCPTMRYIACSSEAASDQDVELTTVGWNVLISAVFVGLPATANSAIWLQLVHLQSSRDIVVALDHCLHHCSLHCSLCVLVHLARYNLPYTKLFRGVRYHELRQSSLLLTWLLDILMRSAGVVRPRMGHGGVPVFSAILMKSWSRARVCALI